MTPPSVNRISGEIAQGDGALLLRIETEADASDFRLARSDVAGLVHMLLALGSQPLQAGFELGGGGGAPSLPVAALSIGEDAVGEALLGVEVGAVRLTFSFPRAALAQLARAMLAASAGDRPAA